MKADFWRDRWENQQTGWHQAAPNPIFTDHFHHLNLQPGARVFVPLCGKSLDMHWLRENGFRVAGAELYEPAVQQLFAELGVTPQISETVAHKHYHADGLDIWVGDIFALSVEQLGPVDAVYDRGALVALPPAMRATYIPHMLTVTGNAPQLLVTYDYDTTRMEGPPFAIPEDELANGYDAAFTRTRVYTQPVEHAFEAPVIPEEIVWTLAPR